MARFTDARHESERRASDIISPGGSALNPPAPRRTDFSQLPRSKREVSSTNRGLCKTATRLPITGARKKERVGERDDSNGDHRGGDGDSLVNELRVIVQDLLHKTGHSNIIGIYF